MYPKKIHKPKKNLLACRYREYVDKNESIYIAPVVSENHGSSA